MVKKCCVYTRPNESYIPPFPKKLRNATIMAHPYSCEEKKFRRMHSSLRKFLLFTANSHRLLNANSISTISPAANNKIIEVLSDILIQQPHSVTSESEILHPSTSLETPVIAGTSSCNIEEPLSKKLCPSVKEMGVQTVTIKCINPLEEDKEKRLSISKFCYHDTAAHRVVKKYNLDLTL